MAPGVTAHIYGHIGLAQQRQAAARMDAVLAEAKAKRRQPSAPGASGIRSRPFFCHFAINTFVSTLPASNPLSRESLSL